MKVRLRYFASVREAVGRGAEERETGTSSLGALRQELVALGAPYAEALAPGRGGAHGVGPGDGR
jgi:molybdopterin synthase sulfur carrier subunit